MADEHTGADSLHWLMTGAQTIEGMQGDPDASLGKYASKDRIQSLGFRRITAIGDVRIWHVSSENGAGVGILEAVDADELTWTPPDGTTGTPVTILDRERKVITGSDINKFVVVQRLNSTALAGTETVQLSVMMNNVPGLDNVSSDEASAGDTEYRAAMVRNMAKADIDNLTVWHGELAPRAASLFSQLPGSGAGQIEGIGKSFVGWAQAGFTLVVSLAGTILEAVYYASRTDEILNVAAAHRGLLGTSATAGSNTDSIHSISGYRIAKEAPVSNAITDKTGAGEGSQPGGLTWVVSYNAATGVSIGTLTKGERYGLWFEREIPVGAVASALVDVEFRFSFDDQTPTTYAGKLLGMHRIANDALRGWLTYVGDDQLPDFEATEFDFEAVAVGTTAADYSTPALTADQISRVVLRFRNQHGVIQQEFTFQDFDVAASGALNHAPPSPPQGVLASAAQDGAVQVTALYNPNEDGDEAADTWAIWIETDGTSPDPDVDAVTDTVDMIVGSGDLQALDYTSASGLVDGAVAVVAVRTRRNFVDPVDSINTDTVSTTVNSVAPVKPGGALSVESVFAQRQVPATAPTSPTDDFVVDAGNNIRFEPGDGRVDFYGDTVLIWTAIIHAEDQADNYVYFPDGWTRDQVTGVGAGGSSDPIEVISWTGPDKQLGVNVNGTRVMLIDVTNLVIHYQSRNQIDAVVGSAAPTPVHPQFDKVRFQVWDGAIEDWVTYFYVDSSGEWRWGEAWWDETLTQAAIEAL